MSTAVSTTNRLTQLFSSKKKNILNIYCTAGYPELNSTVDVLRALETAGVEIIELGIPFSDPLADGPVIQASGQRALENGITLKKIFEQVAEARQSITIPIVLMGYYNTILQFGSEAFCQACSQAGVDGVILPDLPIDVFDEFHREGFEQAGISPVFLITPQTSEERIRSIDALRPGFIYAVSSASTTGTKNSIDGSEEYLQRIQDMQLQSPVLTGFNIKDASTYQLACKYTTGAIIGSAFIKALDESDLKNSIHSFVKNIRDDHSTRT